MPQHVYTIPAHGLSLDAQTNRVTVFAIIEELGASGFPVILPEVNIVTLWKRSPGEEGAEFMQRTRLLDPDGEPFGEFESSLTLEKPRHRMLGKILLVPFEKAGTYTIEVSIRSKDVTTYGAPVSIYPIEVIVQDSASGKNLFDSPEARTLSP